jgi:hypothetical protein
MSPAVHIALARPPTFIQAAMAHARRPRMPSNDVRFALVREPTNPLAKPQACVTLGELARTIHRDRRGAPIQLLDDVALNIAGWGEVTGVAIWTLSEGGDQHRYIGWAWLNGAKAAALRSALDALQSTAPTIGRERAA